MEAFVSPNRNDNGHLKNTVLDSAHGLTVNPWAITPYCDSLPRIISQVDPPSSERRISPLEDNIVSIGVGDVGPPQRPIEIIDNPFGLEVYAEAPHGTFFASGMVTISFYSPRDNHMGKTYRTIVARITMPLAGANKLATDLLDFLDKVNIALRATPPPSSRE